DPRAPQPEAAGDRGLPPGGGAQGRHPHQQRRSRGRAVGGPPRALARGPSPMSKPTRLVWEKPDGSRIEFQLEAAVHLVGREGAADIQIDEPLVSRNHARLEKRAEAW